MSGDLHGGAACLVGDGSGQSAGNQAGGPYPVGLRVGGDAVVVAGAVYGGRRGAGHDGVLAHQLHRDESGNRGEGGRPQSWAYVPGHGGQGVRDGDGRQRIDR